MYFGASQHWVSQAFLYQSWNHVFSSQFHHGHMPLCNWKSLFINLLCLSDHWVNVPATNTRVPDNKDCCTLLVPMEASGYGSGSTQSPSVLWQFCCIHGWAQKRASKSKWQFNCLYLGSLYKCNGPEFSLRLTGVLYSYPALSCCHRKHLLVMLILLQGNNI